jgi:dephospho-CoA kinase
MLRVGLTGGVGSGKSRVADMLSELGARVSRSDEVGRAMMQPDQPVMQAIAAHFGPSVLTDRGALDRARLAQIAFADGRVEELNALVHPAVIAEQSRWMEMVAVEHPSAVAVIESALIFETKHGSAQDATPWRTRFDRIVVVTAPEALRRARYLARADANADAAAADFDRRMQAQWSDERKAALADIVLQNDGSIEDLQAKVADLYAALKQGSNDRSSEAM